MSWRRAKTPGWAAFDPKRQQKQVTDNQTHSDPYPPISSNMGTQNFTRNGERSFSSVLTHSDAHSPLNVANLIAIRDVDTLMENNVLQIYEQLKELHPMANDNLIEDIVAAVDNDVDKASTLLRDMASPGRLHKNKETKTDLHVGESAQVSLNSLIIKNDEALDDRAFSGKVLLDDNVPLRFMTSVPVPVEPEWDDDDLYLLHRKEAIRAMRLASRYSKASTEAFLRRDHVAAKELSRKAQEEWTSAEKLNAKAAKEILTIRNSENDDWKLDLHGLHAAEAVQVLLDHLLRIESQVSDKTNDKASSETDKKSSRPRLLQIITGKGNHSRGQAALPVAIKSFLSEKEYYYYEARAGVITVQPKFRQLSIALPNTYS